MIASDLTKENILRNEVERYFITERKSMGCDIINFCKSKNCFLYLKPAARDLFDMTATSAPLVRVFSHAGKLCNCSVVQNEPILVYRHLPFSCL